MNELEKLRIRVADRVRQLRTERRWSQAELAGRLRLSQSRLSEIERGAGSFTAEQLLMLLRLFNVGVSYFAPSDAPDAEAELQNALARFGARHLYESENVLPSERLVDVNDVVYEAVVVATPRLLVSVAPVLIEHADLVNLPRLDRRLREAGLDRRLGWLIENVRAAVAADARKPVPRALAQQYRRAGLVWDGYLAHASARLEDQPKLPDLLDAGIRSKQTMQSVAASSSPISQRWGIITSLRPSDFTAALEAAHVGA